MVLTRVSRVVAQPVQEEPPLSTQTAEPAPYALRWLAFSTIVASAVMDLLDSTVVNVAAPAIRKDLGGSYADLQWIAAGYTLALAVALLTGGRLGDIFGRKRMLLVGMAGFTLSSLACALAPSPGALIAARVLQGGFGAMMLPQGFGLIRDMFPPSEMGKAFTAFGPIMGLSAVLGPIIAGGLIDADLWGTGWRMIFMINLPIGLAAFVLGVRTLPSRPERDRTVQLDLAGMVLAGVGMCMLVFPLVQGRELGWPGWIIAVLVCSIPVLAGFAWHELRRGRSGATPLVELSIFSRRSYSAGALFAIVFFGSMGGIMLAIGIFLQVGLGYTPIHASLTMAPWALGSFIGSGFGGAMMSRLGRHILHIGLTLMGIATVWLYAVISSAGIAIGHWDFTLPLALSGIGMGMIFVPMFDIIIGEIEDHEVGSGSSTLNAIQQLGMSLGVAVLGTLFFGTLGGQAHATFDQATAPALRAQLVAAHVPAQDVDRVVAALRSCVYDRENEKDPNNVPASCRPSGSAPDPAVVRVLTSAGLATHERVAVKAAQATTLVTAGLVALSFVVGFLLPKKARRQELAEAGAASAVEPAGV